MANLNVHFYIEMLVVCLFFDETSSEYKQWQPNTNWDNSNNWETGKVPCSSQDIQLISLQPLVVAMSGQMSLRSLSLPANSELIMNKGAELTFSGKQQDEKNNQCLEGGKVKFTATTPKNWYNPVNWKVVEGDGNPVAYQTNGLLHLNQIPCLHDQVTFKTKDSFMVTSDKEIAVASVYLNGKMYTQQSFKDYLKTSTGRVEFTFKKPFKITGETCSDSKGCFCDTLHAKEAVCSFVKCEQTNCEKPLSPSGSCCKYCGTILKVKPLATFNFDQLKNLVYNLYEKFLQSRATQVTFSISRTQGGLIQLVFADSGNGKKAQSFAEKVLHNISGDSQLTIKETLSSSSFTNNFGSDKGSRSTSVGLAVGIGVGLAVLIVVVIVAIIMFKRKRKQRSNGVQQTSEYERVELQGRSGSSEQQSMRESPDQTNQGQGSTNVLYESTDVRQTFDNPLYERTTDLQERAI